jgi:hypothetical protein
MFSVEAIEIVNDKILQQPKANIYDYNSANDEHMTDDQIKKPLPIRKPKSTRRYSIR